MRVTLFSLFAAGLAFVAWHQSSPISPCQTGIYQSVSGTQFYDDPRDIRPAIFYDIERCYSASARPIIGGTIESSGTFQVESPAPYGAKVKVLSGRYRGDFGWVKTREINKARRKDGSR